MQLSVDATDLRRRVIRVAQTIPVQAAGTMTLLHPRWEGGSHGPTIEGQRMAGLIIHGAGRRLDWRRDPLDAHAFHVDVPAGVGQLDLEFQYLAPLGPNALITPTLVNLQWQHVLLYPAGWYASRIPVAPRLKLPAGLSVAGPLRQLASSGDEVRFEPVPLDQLLDSPVLAAPQTLQRVLKNGPIPVRVTYVASDAAALAGAEAMDVPLRAVLAQTERVFGRPPFPRFDFLVPLNDQVPGPGGLEHAQAAEVTLPADFLSDPQASRAVIDLFAHEYVHAWNGKYVQPRGHWTPTPNEPMRNSLMWVYEGQSEFWGRVIGARAGLRSFEDTLDALAIDAAAMANLPGRRWKSLGDSALDPITMPGGRGVSWRDWQRRKDYYTEGVLLWLDVDGLLREHSRGRHGLDDFAAAFFGVNGQPLRLYTAEDVSATLSRLAPDFDWRRYLATRVDGHDDRGLLDGLERAGYRLVYSDTPSAYYRQSEEGGGVPDFTYSLGLAVNARGNVRAVGWEGPAFKAGLVPGARITRIGDEPFRAERLMAAVMKRDPSGIVVTIDVDGRVETTTLRYDGGPRYPRLERIADRPDGLRRLLAPR